MTPRAGPKHGEAPGTARVPGAWTAAWVLVAAVLRAPGLCSDFWLDEIWSLRLAQSAAGLPEIVFGMETSNNHILVTAWLYAVSGSGSELLYRLPSFAAGLAAVPLAAAVAARYGPEARLLAAPIAALWYPLLPYSTEARGYALAAAAALAAWAWSREPKRAWAFAVACATGLLSQLVFVYVYAALLVRELAAGRGSSWSDRLRRHALPLVILLGVAVPQARRLSVDGPGYELGRVAAEAIGLLLATPASPLWAAAAGLAACGVFWLAARSLRAAGDRTFLATLFAVPAAAALSGPQVLFSRYFLPAAACFLPVLACALGVLMRGGHRRLLAAGLAAFGALQLWASAPFLRHGRGGYGEAVRYLQSAQPGVARVASDHDFRNRMVLEYHAPAVPPGRIVYVPREEAEAGGADWFLVHRLAASEPPPAAEFVGPRSERFRLERVFPHAGPAGWDWFLYRKAGR